MKKIIKLTESELTSLVERIVTENLNESINVNGVKMSAANSKSGGPIKVQFTNITNIYSVMVDTWTYDGAVGVKFIYKEGGKYYMRDNTDKKFELDMDNLKYITNEVKKGTKIIKINKLGAEITFTKK